MRPILKEWAAPDEDSSAMRLMRDGAGEVNKEIAKWIPGQNAESHWFKRKEGRT